MLKIYSKLKTTYIEVGFKIFVIKIFKFIKKNFTVFSIFLFLLPFLLVIVFLVRFVSIFRQVRFFSLNFDRIGNLYPLYWYQKLQSQTSGKFIDLFFIEQQNARLITWKNITTRKIIVLPFSLIWKNFIFLNNFFWNSEKYKIKDLSYLTSYYSTQQNYEESSKIIKDLNLDYFLQKKINLLNFKKKEIKIGQEFLKKKKTKDFTYVCFSSRDSAYLKYYNKNKNWDYHNWRNCNINNYQSALNYLSQKDIVCFRTGYKVEKKISFSNDKIIDYADSIYQSQFLDIYLPSRCLFSINAQSGITIPAEFCGRPIVYVNWPDMHLSAWHNNSLVIFKKFFSSKKKRYLKFKEILDLDHKVLTSNFKIIQKKFDIVLEENSPDEIKDVVEEQLKRINNEWVETNEDKILQKKFWNIYDKKFVKSPTFRVGANFLKKNIHLI